MDNTESKGLVVRMVEHMTDEEKLLAEDGGSAPSKEIKTVAKTSHVARYVSDPYTGYRDKGIYLN